MFGDVPHNLDDSICLLSFAGFHYSVLELDLLRQFFKQIVCDSLEQCAKVLFKQVVQDEIYFLNIH